MIFQGKLRSGDSEKMIFEENDALALLPPLPTPLPIIHSLSLISA